MRKLDRLGWVDSYTFEIGGELFGVRTTSQAFGNWITETFSSYIVDEEAEPYLSVVIEDDAESVIKKKSMLYRGATSLISTVHVPTVAQSLICELEFFVMAERDEALLATAAPALVNGSTVLIPTTWTWGLVGLSRKMQRVGVILPASHGVWIDEGGTMLPATGLLDVPSDALDRLAKHVGGNGTPERLALTKPTRVDATLVRSPARASEHDATIHPVSRAYTVYTLASEVVETNQLDWQTALESLGGLVTEARCYGITSWRPEDVLASIASAA